MIKEKKFISAVIYLNNGEKRISTFLNFINKYFFEKFENYEIIIVNDNSIDNSINLINNNKEINGNIVVINLPWKHKLELAMMAGTDFAIGDYIFEFDSLLIDYDYKLLDDMYEKSINGFDIIGAVSKNSKKLSSNIFYKFLNMNSFTNLELNTETVRIVSRRALNRILDLKQKIRYRKALYRYSGFPLTNVYYNSIGKEKNVRNLTFKEKLGLASDVLFMFSNIGLRISLFLSTLFFLISASIGIYAIIIFFNLKTVISGWTTSMLFMSFGFSGLFLITAVLGKYLTMILTEIQDRPNYIIKSIERVNKNIIN